MVKYNFVGLSFRVRGFNLVIIMGLCMDTCWSWL